MIWPNNRKVSELAPHLDRLALVALAFPKFQDGRAYSQARQLREQYGFRGELRATGDVLRDQRLFLLRAGFDAFEVKKDADVKSFVEQNVRYSVFYQPAGDARVSALRQRRPSLGPSRSHRPTIRSWRTFKAARAARLLLAMRLFRIFTRGVDYFAQRAQASCTPFPDCAESTSGVFLQAFFSLALCVLIASGVKASAFDSATISGLSVSPCP